jgi:predicted tellurium resistance membrane protein TerC
MYLNHKKRGYTLLIGALAMSITLAFLFAFPLNWIIMVAYWIWQVFDTFFVYRSENKVSKNAFGERRNPGLRYS